MAHIGRSYFEGDSRRSFTALLPVVLATIHRIDSKFHANVVVARYLFHVLTLGGVPTSPDPNAMGTTIGHANDLRSWSHS